MALFFTKITQRATLLGNKLFNYLSCGFTQTMATKQQPHGPMPWNHKNPTKNKKGHQGSNMI